MRMSLRAVTRADAINVTIPSLGVLTGAGTISPNGALDFNMTADLQTNRAEARAERTGRAGWKGVSFKVQGTTSNPSFVPDVGSLAGRCKRGDHECCLRKNRRQDRSRRPVAEEEAEIILSVLLGFHL